MTWLCLTVASIAAVECFLLLPFRGLCSHLWRSYSKALGTVKSKRISDQWKEKVLLVYAGNIFLDTVKLCCCMATALAPIAGAILIGPLLSLDIYQGLQSPEGLAITIAIPILYYVARRKIFGRV